MKITQPANEFIETISKYFNKENKKIKTNISLCAYAILRSEKINTAEMARYMQEVNNQSFKTNDMRVYRLLQSKNFQVSDRLWRGYIKLIFKLLQEFGIKKGDTLALNVDYTTDRDDFLILCASIQFRGQSIPIYFSLRNYPKRAGMMDQKKLELAFLKSLKHLLPDYFQYILVMDRGFGCKRIIEILENLEFQYIIRLNDNLSIKHKGKNIYSYNLEHKNMSVSKIYVNNWKKYMRLVKHVKNKAYWLLAVSPKTNIPAQIYKQRFSIEKMFKNTKSGGFDLEKIFVNKYDRFKRLLFISCLAYSLFVFTGIFIHNKAHSIKKNYFLHLKLLTVFSV